MSEKAVNASLIFRDHDELKHILLLPGEEVRFGRDQNNDIRLALFPLQDIVFQLATADISRQHFAIQRKDDKYLIQDMGSTNGTSVNCIAVLKKERWLQDQEIIDVGGVLDIKVAIKNGVLQLSRITNTPQEAYWLFKEQISIGKADDNVLVLVHPAVCHHHAHICYRDKKYTIAKVDVEGPVAVNGVPVPEGRNLELENETHITLGGLDILFKLQE